MGSHLEGWQVADLRTLPLEIRVHGRGGQGGVTCAKLLAFLWAEAGLHVQSFGDYGMERSGAPVRAFTRVDAAPITNRNKVYAPQHLLVLDPALLGEEVLEGAAPGALLVLNTPHAPEAFTARHPGLRLATVDAAAIARRHGIGTSAVVIVNTALAAAYARAVGHPWEAVERVYVAHDLADDLGAAREAFEAVALRAASAAAAPARPAAAPLSAGPAVLPIPEHTRDLPTPLRTGSWRTQLPAYRPHPAPCRAACPAGNDIAAVLEALRAGGADAAARLLLATQPLPSVCGRVCPAPCMAACNRGAYDGAVNVRGLERWIGDHAGPEALPPAAPSTARSAAVVGGGPAGIAAAVRLRRGGWAVTLVEREAALGGVLRTGIPAYRLPPDALDRDLARLRALAIDVRCGAAVGPGDLAALAARHDAVIVATGLPVPVALRDPGAGLPGVEDGLRFLRDARRGAPRLGGHVVVIGGGNTAIDCARTALRGGAARVTLAYRRGRAEMPAIAEEIDEAIAEGVQLLPLRQPVRFEGGARVTGVELAEVQLGEPDASGRPRPVVTARRELLACDHVLLAIGQGADRALLPDPAPANVWLAGDLAAGEGTVSAAIGHGRRVAERVLAAREGRPVPAEAAPAADDVVTPAHVRFGFFAPRPPAHERRRAPRQRRGFEEVSLGLAGPEEADRCFACGHCTRCDTCLLSCPEAIIRRAAGPEGGYAIDEDYCKGCGLCVAECPRRAMEMIAEGRSAP